MCDDVGWIEFECFSIFLVSGLPVPVVTPTSRLQVQYVLRLGMGLFPKPLSQRPLLLEKRLSVDGRAVFWGLLTGSNPTDRAKRGSKRHLICDGNGIPLAIKLTGANCYDSTQALPLLDSIPVLQGPRGRPRCHPHSVLGDRAYDAERIRRALRSRQILPRLAMRNTKHGSGLGRLRWVVGTYVRMAESVSPSPRAV